MEISKKELRDAFILKLSGACKYKNYREVVCYLSGAKHVHQITVQFIKHSAYNCIIRVYYDNGQIASWTRIKNGIRSGNHREWSKSGALILFAKYWRGIPRQIINYFDDGTKLSRKFNKFGERVGRSSHERREHAMERNYNAKIPYKNKLKKSFVF